MLQYQNKLHMKNLIFFGLLMLIFYSCQTPERRLTDKTLVSWVTLHDINVDHGSILTIQHGSQFDGIVLGEIETGKWIAGSDHFNRTNQDMSNLVPEKEENLAEMIQMAIVYEGNEIRLYRNGKLYSKYEVENIDLLSFENNSVSFGIRHVGGSGSISGDIEDARIYREALTVKQLNELKPNVASRIEPYAWWDFEGDEIIERTGRYVNHILGNVPNIKQEEGMLKIREWGKLIVSGPHMPETPEWPENPPDDWLTFHLSHPGPGIAEPGDPNPAYYYKGRYHLHYIYVSTAGYAYAHLSSKDMIYWKWHTTALEPTFTNHGMFSGTGFFTREGQPAMIYHGFGSGRNQLVFTLDDNLDTWTRPRPIIPLDEDGTKPEMSHWDPDCWIIGDTYYALSGGRDPDLMKSDDLENWKYMGKLLHEEYPENLDVPREEDISCANMFKIGNKWMLLCISHKLGCRYFLGDFKDDKYLPDFHAKMNWVNTNWEENHGRLVYFAPESMLTADGRRVMWAWLINGGKPSGIQSLPRELELPEDGILRIKPLRELKTLRYDEVAISDVLVKRGNDFMLTDIKGDAFELEINFSAPLSREFGIKMLADDSGENGINIIAGMGRKTLGFADIEPPFELNDGEDLILRIFVDKNLVEVFANDRQAAAYIHDYIRSNPNISIFTNDGDIMVKEIKAWKMKSIYK
jgi:sucrose-6-phosphate hydrolase SacC (GH32 family)